MERLRKYISVQLTITDASARERPYGFWTLNDRQPLCPSVVGTPHDAHDIDLPRCLYSSDHLKELTIHRIAPSTLVPYGTIEPNVERRLYERLVARGQLTASRSIPADAVRPISNRMLGLIASAIAVAQPRSTVQRQRLDEGRTARRGSRGSAMKRAVDAETRRGAEYDQTIRSLKTAVAKARLGRRKSLPH
jgi:hypothetical protein